MPAPRRRHGRGGVQVPNWQTCKSGKLSYGSKKNALVAKRQLIGSGHGDSGLSAYRCECGDWHLGHLHDDTKRGTAV